MIVSEGRNAPSTPAPLRGGAREHEEGRPCQGRKAGRMNRPILRSASGDLRLIRPRRILDAAKLGLQFAVPPSLDPGSQPSGFHSPGSTKFSLDLNGVLGRIKSPKSLTLAAVMLGIALGLACSPAQREQAQRGQDDILWSMPSPNGSLTAYVLALSYARGSCHSRMYRVVVCHSETPFTADGREQWVWESCGVKPVGLDWFDDSAISIPLFSSMSPRFPTIRVRNIGTVAVEHILYNEIVARVDSAVPPVASVSFVSSVSSGPANYVMTEVRTYSYENGKPAARGRHLLPKGKPNNPTREGHWSDHLRVGDWEYWFDNGQIRARLFYEVHWYVNCGFMGHCPHPYELPVGQFKLWHRDGSLRGRGQFSEEPRYFPSTCGPEVVNHALPSPSSVFWDEDGTRISEEKFMFLYSTPEKWF